jgi:hypothetical protein
MKKVKFAVAGLMAVTMLYGCGASTGGTKSSAESTTTPVVSKAAMKSAISVAQLTQYASNSGASSKVKAECRITSQLPDFVESFASQQGIAVAQKGGSLSTNSKGKVLVMEFTNIHGAAGGAWSGAKSVTVSGELFENGKKIGSFQGRRSSGGGGWGAYKGTCSILGRCVKTLGKDIAGWLAKPSMNAKLGEL